MEKYEIVKKQYNRHIRYVYSKDSKRRLEYYGLEPKEIPVERVTLTISEFIEIKFALESLSALEQMIVQNNIMGYETLESISNRLCIPIITVKRKKKAALIKLREYLK